MPAAVRSTGYSKVTDAIDHAVTCCRFDGDGAAPLVVAEGGWAMTDGFAFTMQYMVNFERATARFDINADDPLVLCEAGSDPQPIELEPGMGYDYMTGSFIECVAAGRAPQVVTMDDAARSVELVEAAVRSIERTKKCPLPERNMSDAPVRKE